VKKEPSLRGGNLITETTINQFLIMEEVLKQPYVITDMKKKLKDILMIVSWRELSNTYFHKSSSWFYHKMDGIDGNGGQGGFSETEALQLRGALIDMSERLRKAADEIF
jgi:hypothetical protein